MGINNMVKAGKECHELHKLKAGLGRMTICRASFRSLVESELPGSSTSKQKQLSAPVCLNCASASLSHSSLSCLVCAAILADSALSLHFILEATVDETELLAPLINVSLHADVPGAFCNLAGACRNSPSHALS